MTHSKLSPSDLHGRVLKCPSAFRAYTPGPWRYAAKSNIGNCVEGQSGNILYDLDDGYRTVATVQSCLSSDLFVDERKNLAANIALISAAPDLLEALIEARAELEAYEADATGERYNNPTLNAAIAKAIGEGQ